MSKVMRTIGAVIGGFLTFAVVFVISITVTTLLLGWIAEIPVLGRLMFFLGTGGAKPSEFTVSWYVYFVPLLITGYATNFIIELICEGNPEAHTLSKKIVGISIVVLYVISAIINLVMFFMGDVAFSTIVINIMFVICGGLIAYGD